ncbi:MAG: CXXX repeat peptide maturase [Muribaculaceae bacterium]|nr:CXXX repeat peptide maturase [Muribaculaceae bacterium]
MLQYLMILLDDTSTSYCHYNNKKSESKLISIEDLKAGIFFGMTENLMIQYVYPSHALPAEYEDVLESIDHSKIMPADNPNVDEADVVVFNDWKQMEGFSYSEGVSYVLRINKSDLFEQKVLIADTIEKTTKLNVVITDVESFCDEDFDTYKGVLQLWSEKLEKLYAEGKSPLLNLLTDRMQLEEMNNCGAGESNITLAPDGKFYVCPAFYQTNSDTIISPAFKAGSLEEGVHVKSSQLYKLDHAPLCRKCDAFHCRRCVWLNRKTTLEVNTPSHEQCVVAHLERNPSRQLLENIRKHGQFLTQQEIKEIDYLDPFDVKEEW